VSDWQKRLERQGLDLSTLRRLEEAEEAIYLLTTPGAEAMPLWRRLRALVDESGHWPIILGSTEDLETHAENLEEAEDVSTQTLLRAAERLDARAWLHEQGDPGAEPIDEWPSRVPDEPGGDAAFSIPTDILTRKPLRKVHLALVPTRVGWEVPAFLRFGGWNACPQPEEHVSLWKYWGERYGAEIVGISGDVVEAAVSHPPLDREAALTLAREQSLYCDDIVSQGCGSLSVLAALLLRRSSWYFWWD
jgi:hypothetical protein